MGPAASKQPWSSVFPNATQKATEALALPFFSELYQQEDLKTAQSQVDWDFDSCHLTKRSLQDQIFVECHNFHPEQSFEAHVVALQPEALVDDGTIRIHCRSLGGELLMIITANQSENLIALRADIARKLDEPA